jgi:hypothetical protein
MTTLEDASGCHDMRSPDMFEFFCGNAFTVMQVGGRHEINSSTRYSLLVEPGNSSDLSGIIHNICKINTES